MTGHPHPSAYQVPGLGEVTRERWVEMSKAVSEQNTAHLKAWRQQQRDAGQIWTAVYWRYQAEYKDEEFSLEDAKETLVYGEEAGSLSAVGVICPDGAMLKYDYSWDKDFGLD